MGEGAGRDSGATGDRAHLLLLGIVTAFLSCSLLFVADRYAVDLLLGDQWDLYAALMEPRTAWELFRWQHPPHRQGVGMLLMASLADRTEWDLRASSFAVAATLIMAALVALALKRALFPRWHSMDVVIPLIVLSWSQWATLLGVVNPSHAAIPLLLVLLSVVIWSVVPEPGRVVMLSVLMFVASHTGFAVVLVPVLAVMYALRLREGENRPPERICGVLGIAAAVISLLVFAAGLRFGAAADCFEPLGSDLFFIPPFAFIMFARFIGVSFLKAGVVAPIVGAIVVAVALVISGKALVRQWQGRSDRLDAAITILLGFSLVFAAAAGYGRACLPAAMAESSRYMTLMVPAFLALYFAALRAHSRWAAILLLLGVTLGSLPLPGPEHPAAVRSSYASAWRECYRSLRDAEACTEATRFSVHPKPLDTRLDRKLKWLEERELSLFRPDETGRDATGSLGSEGAKTPVRGQRGRATPSGQLPRSSGTADESTRR